jgi:hypothetical protein
MENTKSINNKIKEVTFIRFVPCTVKNNPEFLVDFMVPPLNSILVNTYDITRIARTIIRNCEVVS